METDKNDQNDRNFTSNELNDLSTKANNKLSFNGYKYSESGDEIIAKANKSYFKIGSLLTFLLFSIVFSFSCLKNENDEELNSFKNIEYRSTDFSRTVCIGKVVDGKPYLDDAIRDEIVHGISEEKYTYKRLFCEESFYEFEESSLELFTNEKYSGIYYLSLRGIAYTAEGEFHFIIAYQLVFDQAGLIYNLSTTQHACMSNGCSSCLFKYNSGNSIVGCKPCPDLNGACNHSTFTIDKSGYLVIPIKIE